MRRLFAFLFLAFAPALSAQTRIDTVRAGRFDSGKMWTFEYAPRKFFSETYGFDANDQWFERARLAAHRQAAGPWAARGQMDLGERSGVGERLA